MGFWSQTEAAPSLWLALGWSELKPAYLRPASVTAPSEFSFSGKLARVERLTTKDADALSDFLEMHYGGRDWTLRCREWIDAYLSDPRVVVLAMKFDDQIVATIASTPVSSGPVLMSHGARLERMQVIEGLCVHPDLRGAGVAGLMIHQMDAHTSRAGPVAHLWAREMPAAPLLSTALSTESYGYLDCDTVACVAAKRMEWKVFEILWSKHCSMWLTLEPCIVGTLPVNRRGDLTVWSNGVQVAVVQNTRRVAKGKLMYEVAWCGYLTGDGAVLMPSRQSDDHGPLLEAVACHLKSGLLFATDHHVRRWTPSWTHGTSGVHAWYIYNYIPPVFGTCRIHVIREEL